MIRKTDTNATTAEAPAPADYLRETHHEFEKASQAALQDDRLQVLLGKLSENLGKKNREAWSTFEQGDACREAARRIKDETLAELDVHLEAFEKAVVERGGHVHWAHDAADACRMVTKIIHDRGAKKVVKSKSMTTEEIHLNKALAEEAIEVVETDLGEYIIQIAGHRPSHIVGPALHLDTKQIGEILQTQTKDDLPVEREAMTAFARKQLRAKFAEAEVGITGGNFAIAETGTIVLISNEGNARLTTSLPKTLISVVGMEKVIPRLADLPYFLKVLARAATGQKMSVYTSMITGPRKPDETEGPEEFHVILLDNGRSKILAGPLRESLFCIRCGACLNACPIYRSVGGHAYGGVYSGPIGAVITPLYDGLAANHHLPHASSLCGACQAACPVKIQIPEMLVRLREKLHDEPMFKSTWERFAYGWWAWLQRHPRWWRNITWLVSRTLGWWHGKSGWVSRLPGKLHGWTEKRDFPAPAQERFRDWWRKEGGRDA